MDLSPRPCPVCRYESPEGLYVHRFRALIGVTGESYDQHVCQCLVCGMVYVTPHLDLNQMREYYSHMSCYEYNDADNIHYTDPYKSRSQRQYYWIQRHATAAKTVLDIGCSIGYTLSLFAGEGTRLVGIDPSATCKLTGEARFPVRIINGFLDTINPEEVDIAFEVVILSHVLEHLDSPRDSLAIIRQMLSNDGVLFIEIPSIELFDEQDPYQFFFEHINYFSLESLETLMGITGFEKVDSIVFENDGDVAPFFPTLGTLWRKGEYKPTGSIRSSYRVNNDVIRRYIEVVTHHKLMLEKRISEITERHARLAIWCAGTMTSQLLAQTSLADANVVAIFDNDSKKTGRVMVGRKIFKPDFEEIRRIADAVLIGSWSSQNEIYEQILHLEDSGVKVYKLFDR